MIDCMAPLDQLIQKYEAAEREGAALRERLRHLLTSKTVQMFDEKDPHTGEYVRDIRRLDTYGLPYKLREYERSRKLPQQQEAPPMPAVKPPLGVMPRRLHDEKRREELQAAIIRYAEAGQPVDPAWVEEYNELTDKGVVL